MVNVTLRICVIQVIFEYVKVIRINLYDEKTVAECIYWWVNEAIQGRDILEAFENYLDGKLFTDFNDCKDKSICLTAMNVSIPTHEEEKRKLWQEVKVYFLIIVIFFC